MRVDERVASWDRVNVSLGAGLRLQVTTPRAQKSMELNAISRNLMEHLKSMEFDETEASWYRVDVSLRAGLRLQVAKPQTPEIYRNP